jgi:hypothetical protein
MTTAQEMNEYLLSKSCAERLGKDVTLADGQARWTDTGAPVSTDSIIERLAAEGIRFRRADREAYEPCPRAIASTIKMCFDMLAGLSAGPGTVTVVTIDDDDPEADAVVTRILRRESASC